MVDIAYENLIPALNLRSTSLPSVKCEEYFALVSYLFTPEQAAIISAMPMGFASAEEISKHLAGSDIKSLAAQLDVMADKGLIHSKQTDGKTVYEVLPFFPGIVELQYYRKGVDDYVKQLDVLLGKYQKALRNMTKSGAGYKIDTSLPGRTVKVDVEVWTKTSVIPYEEMKELIENTDVIAAGICHCRQVGALNGNPCSRPNDNCMLMGTSAQFTIERGFTKQLSKAEALEMLDNAEKAALVHSYGNTPHHFSNILCNCCSCHCTALTGWNRTPDPSTRVIARYLVRIDESKCNNCQACIERCQTHALKMENGKLVRDEKRCLGCGLCRYVCPMDALILEKRPAGLVPLHKC